MSDRYAKQLLLPEIGAEGQACIEHGRVLCVGAGGLGCASLPYLAGAGVGHITILDDDRVDRSNLQRQVLFTDADLGRPKAEVAAGRLARQNPEIRVTARTERLNADNVETLYREHDLVIDGSDNFATKYLAGDASVKFAKPLVYGSATGMEALVTVFDADSGPCLRCLFPEAPSGWVPNCAEAGVLGPLVGAAGCVQAMEALKMLARPARPELSPLIGRLWMLDARDAGVRNLVVPRRADCRVCGTDPKTIELQPLPARIGEIEPDQLPTLGEPVLIDVREVDEYHSGHLPGAINRPLSALETGECELPESGLCVVYCASGVRARRAIEHAGDRHGRKLWNLRGGIQQAIGDKRSDS